MAAVQPGSRMRAAAVGCRGFRPSSCSIVLPSACVMEHTAEHVFQRFASSNYPQTGPFGFPAEGFMWIGLVSTCSSADRRSEGGGILMSRSGLLFGTRLGAKAPLIFNILLKHLFILMQPRLSGFSRHILVFLNDFPSPHPAGPPQHQVFFWLLSGRPRRAYQPSADRRCDGGMSDRLR